MGKSTISMEIFNSKLFVYQRVEIMEIESTEGRSNRQRFQDLINRNEDLSKVACEIWQKKWWRILNDIADPSPINEDQYQGKTGRPLIR